MVLLIGIKKFRTFVKSNSFEILIFCIMGILVFVNLDRLYFGSDEGYNVTMGQYIIKNGLPKVWDGKNVITTINGNDFNNNFLCINLNWGAYYITALGQLLFGKSSIGIRSIFAIMGLLSSLFWYKYVKIISNVVVARIFFALYCLSIPLIIYIRNANYFAPSLFFVGIMYLSYKKTMMDVKKIYLVIFIMSSFLQFHVNYMLFVFAIGPILFDFFINAKYYRRFIISFIIMLSITIPFFIWMRYNFLLLGSSYRSIIKMSFSKGYFRFLNEFWHINYYTMPIISLLIICIFVNFLYKLRIKRTIDNYPINNKKDNWIQKKLVISISLGILFNFIFLSFFTNEFETRYYLAIFPLLYILASFMIYSIYRKDKIVAYILICLLLFTNIINILPYQIIKMAKININGLGVKYIISQPIPKSYDSDTDKVIKSLKYESYFLKYVINYYKPVTDEVNSLVTYLNKHAQNGDTITTFGTLPWTNSIQFYTNLRLVNNLRPNFGSWANDKQYPNAKRYGYLVYYPDELVDWAVFTDSPEYTELINKYLYNVKYEKILIKHNLRGLNNDIWLYQFSDSKDLGERIIFKRKKSLQ